MKNQGQLVFVLWYNFFLIFGQYEIYFVSNFLLRVYLHFTFLFSFGTLDVISLRGVGLVPPPSTPPRNHEAFLWLLVSDVFEQRKFGSLIEYFGGIKKLHIFLWEFPLEMIIITFKSLKLTCPRPDRIRSFLYLECLIVLNLLYT